MSSEEKQWWKWQFDGDGGVNVRLLEGAADFEVVVMPSFEEVLARGYGSDVDGDGGGRRRIWIQVKLKHNLN
ncbi:Hypothetical predicted protein [Olea europaea subsp. europaea]|uniref:Uncharacterized protein n=1 Tax=Olea europaea subsp. europaea TaxID=158383 RepID=A0A8S0PK26_OLEEU|nr:Hypothetical predicted protein [Olea europaea subsp. europaea]